MYRDFHNILYPLPRQSFYGSFSCGQLSWHCLQSRCEHGVQCGFGLRGVILQGILAVQSKVTFGALPNHGLRSQTRAHKGSPQVDVQRGLPAGTLRFHKVTCRTLPLLRDPYQERNISTNPVHQCKIECSPAYTACNNSALSQLFRHSGCK